MTAGRYLTAWLSDRHRLALDLADARDENVHLARELDRAECDSAQLAGDESRYLVENTYLTEFLGRAVDLADEMYKHLTYLSYARYESRYEGEGEPCPGCFDSLLEWENFRVHATPPRQKYEIVDREGPA